MRKLEYGELRRTWDEINLLKGEMPVQIFLERTVDLDNTIKDALRSARKRGVQIEIIVYSDNRDNPVEGLLAQLIDNEKFPSGANVRKIVLASSRTSRSIEDHLGNDDKLADAEHFRNVRVLNIVAPDKRSLKGAKKVVYQSHLVRQAVRAALLRPGEGRYLKDRQRFMRSLEGSLDPSVIKGDFVDQLVKEDRVGATPQEIKDRIQPFLNDSWAIRLIQTLEQELRAIKQFWTAA
jgi:hypothetical protein